MNTQQETPQGIPSGTPLTRVKAAVEELGYLPPSEALAIQKDFGISPQSLEAMEERFRNN
jgi:hypothetical protein